jgi:hypothetical protein
MTLWGGALTCGGREHPVGANAMFYTEWPQKVIMLLINNDKTYSLYKTLLGTKNFSHIEKKIPLRPLIIPRNLKL